MVLYLVSNPCKDGKLFLADGRKSGGFPRNGNSQNGLFSIYLTYNQYVKSTVVYYLRSLQLFQGAIWPAPVKPVVRTLPDQRRKHRLPLCRRPQIRMPEIIALPQHRLALLARQRVGEAAAEVQPRRWHPVEGRSTLSMEALLRRGVDGFSLSQRALLLIRRLRDEG